MIANEKLVEMVQAAQNGDEHGISALYDTFHQDIYYYIFKIVNDEELAADLTQDTFVDILQKIGTLREPGAFITWSRQVAYSRCTAHFRKRKELLADEDEDGYSVFDTLEEDRSEFIPDAALDQEDLKATIQAMCDALPEEQRAALLMRYFEEMSVSQIAEIQGVSEGTVKSRLNYGRNALRKAVEDYEKKNGIKLHCAGVVPLLLWLFAQSGKGAAGTAAAATTTAAATTSAATATTATATAAAATTTATTTAAAGASGLVAKLLAGGLATKLAAGGLAVALTVGGVLGAVSLHTKDEAAEPTQSVEAGTQQETTMPEEPKIPNLEMFEGKWNIVEADFLDEITTLVINADGTIEANGETLTWTAEKAHPNSGCEMILEVNYPADPNFPNSESMWAFEFRLARTPENTYVAEMRTSQTAISGDQFYREGDYEVIALTDENAMEYLEQLPTESSFKVTDSMGSSKEYDAVHKEVIKLKDGLGTLSNFSGRLIFEKTYVRIHLNDDATNFVEGDILNTYIDEQGVWDQIDTKYAREYTYTVYWFGAPGDSMLEKPGTMECNRLVGTKGASGYVFIPVKTTTE